MELDFDTYYALIVKAGIDPLCEQLRKVDNYPALRFILFMEKIHCGGIDDSSYTKNGAYDEFAFSKDLNNNTFSNITKGLNVKPENNTLFMGIIRKILAQQFIFYKNTDLFSADQKLELFQFYKKGLKTKRLIDQSVVIMTNELQDYIRDSIQELETSSGGSNDTLNGKQNDDDSNKNKRRLKEEPSFESFFEDKEIIEPLIDFLHEENIISDDGKWIGKKKRKTDLMGFIDALLKKDLISFDDQKQVGAVFYKKFKLNINIRSVTLTTDIRDDAFELYLELLDDFKLDYTQKSRKKIAT